MERIIKTLFLCSLVILITASLHSQRILSSGNGGNGGSSSNPALNSSTYATLALGCTAAATAHVQLMITQGYTGLTTQTCAANLIFPIGAGGATKLQPASGQVITLTGDLQIPHGTQVLDITSGGFFHLVVPSIDASWMVGAGTAERINACITTAISSNGDSGECDARYFGGLQSMSQQINLGTSASGTAGLTVLLRLPISATWTWALTDGTSCAIKVFNNTLIEGYQAAGGQGSTVLHAPGSANMRSMVCTDPSPSSGGNYVRIENFGIVVDSGATMSEGAAHIQFLFDESEINNFIVDNESGDAIHLTGICCGSVINKAQGKSSEVSGGGYPLLVDGGGNAFTINNSTFNFPGIGKNNMNFAVSGAAVANILCISCYMEKRGATDFSVPMAEIGGSIWNIQFIGGGAAIPACSSCAQVVFNNDTYYGFSVQHYGVSGTTHGIYDAPNARSWVTDGIQIPGYTVGLADGIYLQGITSNMIISAYKSLDGTAGVTGATCTAWKNGICVAN